jgi:hypothetical protein
VNLPAKAPDFQKPARCRGTLNSMINLSLREAANLVKFFQDSESDGIVPERG